MKKPKLKKEDLRTAAVATLLAAKEICRGSRCPDCIFSATCGIRAPEGLTEKEINFIADRIADTAEEEE